MKIEKISVTELVPDPNNARIHSEKNLDAIAKSLKRFGQQKPIVIDSDNVVVAGNGTLEAAKSLGFPTLEAVRLPDSFTEEDKKAFAIADNRSAELAEWNQAILAAQLLELEELDFDIAEVGFEKTEPREISAPEEFPSFDEESETQYRCPKCRYEWNGAAK